MKREIRKGHTGSSLVAQWVKELALSLLQFGLLLCCEFRPWLGFPHAQCVAQKEKKKKEQVMLVVNIHSGGTTFMEPPWGTGLTFFPVTTRV